MTPRMPFNRYHFPPDPHGEAEDWPYDSMTKVAMEPKNKSRKRPIMAGKSPFRSFTKGRVDGNLGNAYNATSKADPHSDGSMSVGGRI
jgi:hypothetical protein